MGGWEGKGRVPEPIMVSITGRSSAGGKQDLKWETSSSLQFSCPEVTGIHGSDTFANHGEGGCYQLVSGREKASSEPVLAGSLTHKRRVMAKCSYVLRLHRGPQGPGYMTREFSRHMSPGTRESYCAPGPWPQSHLKVLLLALRLYYLEQCYMA